MHYVTLEHIDEYLTRKARAYRQFFVWHMCKELFQFGMVFVAVFLLSTITINANLFYHTMKNLIVPVQAQEYSIVSQSDEKADEAAAAANDQKLQTELEATIERGGVLMTPTQTTETYLKAKSNYYTLDFNTLPPENKLIIPAIGVDVPIVDVSVTTEKKLRKGDFDQELYSGVVKYPSTPQPGAYGNTLLFGHTSYYRWKKNPYGEVFAKVYALATGDTIQTIWHGQSVEFEVVTKIIVNPDKVDETYLKYTDGHYITLMGCYPIGSDQRRILIIAKRK